MYDFHYDYIKSKYENKSKLLFPEANSLLYKIKTEDAYEYFSSNKEIFDRSNYSAKLTYCYNSNKLVIGKTKDKTGGVATE